SAGVRVSSDHLAVPCSQDFGVEEGPGSLGPGREHFSPRFGWRGIHGGHATPWPAQDVVFFVEIRRSTHAQRLASEYFFHRIRECLFDVGRAPNVKPALITITIRVES